MADLSKKFAYTSHIQNTPRIRTAFFILALVGICGVGIAVFGFAHYWSETNQLQHLWLTTLGLLLVTLVVSFMLGYEACWNELNKEKE